MEGCLTSSSSSSSWLFNSQTPKAHFCENCGFLLEIISSSGGLIECHLCGRKFTSEQITSVSILTKSKIGEAAAKTKSTKSQLQLAAEEAAEHKNSNRATVDEECPECGHKKMFFYTMQLRSVDEGQTVFYECCKCAYTYSINT